MPKDNQIAMDTQPGHAFFLYSSAAERLAYITEYFKQGIANHELCIFVTPTINKALFAQFKKAGLDARQAIANGDLRIFEMAPTYLPNGQFVADYMLHNVATFLADAEARGFNGLRTAGEMNWLHDHPEFLTEAIQYEDNVNSIQVGAMNFVGLCMYPMQDGFNEILEGAIHTHPSFIYNGQVRTNPYYQLNRSL